MRYTLFVVLFLTGLVSVSQAQMSKKDGKAEKYAATINQDDLSKYLHIIAADSMEGRETGTIGQKKAARYIADFFKKIGLKPSIPGENGSKSYFQKFNRVERSWDMLYIKVGKSTKKFKKDFYPRFNSNMKEAISLDVIFGDLAKLSEKDLKGKAYLYLSRSNDREIAQKARKKGARAVLMIKGKDDKEFLEAVEYNNFYLKRSQKSLSNPNRKEELVFYISPSTAADIMNVTKPELGTLKDGSKGQKVELMASMVEDIQFETENVLGYMEGSDKKDELLVITAHYDHIGKRGEQINNGADDDGSGTVSVLEIAQAFARAKAEGHGPRRSILFMTVAGEEKGLLGSQYYTDISPVFPLENTVADLNIDMIGRIGGDYIKTNDPNYVYLIGSDKLSTELHNLSESVNKKYVNLKLDYKYNDDKDPNRFYYRSDHFNFAKNDIPIIFYFNGVHADYHRPSDTVEKIHFPKLEKIARLVFYTAWEVANREKRLLVDKQ